VLKVPQPVPDEEPAMHDIELLPADVAKPHDDALLDRPPADVRDEPLPDLHRQDREPLESLGIQTLPEHTGERAWPWPIDILLYPTSSGGLTALGLIIGLSLLTLALDYIGLHGVVGLPLFLINGAVGLYIGWYVAECVYDSAHGGTRAPPGFEPGLGFGDIWSRVSYILAVYIVYLFPVVFYRMFFQEMDAVFWFLAAWAILFLPMGLLAMVMHDSVSALNPLFLLGSIFRTFFQYVGLIILFLPFAGLFWLSGRTREDTERSILLDAIGLFVTSYVPFILAHILGRFHWRYKDRLDWGL